MPQPALTDILFDAPLEARGAVGHDVPDVDMEALEHLLTGYGQLLDRIENPGFVFNPQKSQKVLVRFFMDPRLKTAQAIGILSGIPWSSVFHTRSSDVMLSPMGPFFFFLLCLTLYFLYLRQNCSSEYF